MGEALKKSDDMGTSLSLGVEDGLSAALECAVSVGSPNNSVLDYVSKDEWRAMNAQDDNILVFDPD